jgi:hypothetical protein
VKVKCNGCLRVGNQHGPIVYLIIYLYYSHECMTHVNEL